MNHLANGCYVHIDFLPFTKSKHRPIPISILLQAFDVMEYTVRLGGGIGFSMGDVRGMNVGKPWELVG